MPRVHYVKAARKDNPVAKVGEPYYWWKSRYGGKRYSKTRPRPSQLTQSEYFGRIRSMLERIEDSSPSTPDELIELRDELTGELAEIRDECQDKLDNMPESLQYAPTGELLQERIDACDGAESELDGIDDDFETDYKEDTDGWREEFEDWMQAKLDEMTDAISNCEV